MVRPAVLLLRLLPVACGLVLAGTAGRAAASAPMPLSDHPDSALALELARLPGERLLLEDAVARAADAATSTRIARAGLEAAGGVLTSERGSFDPELYGGALWSGADTPSASLFAGAEVLRTESSELEAGARIRLPLGTELSASLLSSRITSNSAFAALSPEYQASGSLALRQPLLKGFGPAARSGLTAAERGLEGAAARYDAAVAALRAEVETLYWQLYAAERNHAVTRLIRARAAAFLEEARLRAGAGVIGPSQVANAEFFLTEAEQAALDTEEQLDRLSDRLASLMGRRPAGDAVRYRSWDEPPRAFATVAADSLVAVAMARNPELSALAADAEAVRARERGAAWDARPTLDLVGGLGGNGLAGAARDVYFPGSATPVRTTIGGDRGESVSQVFRREYPTWNVGFVFALPIGGREDGGERARLAAEVVRSEQQLVAARRTVEEQVRAQQRELERGRERLEIATRGVAASVRQVEIGMLEYRNGRTTAFEVVRLAADLATAQQRYSEALVRTARAAAVLRQLTGGWYPARGDEEN